MRKKLIKSEVIQLFKTTKETLRYYEKAGLIRPEIDDNNYRYYDFKDLEKLRQIFFLRDIDLSIEEMQKLDKKLLERDEYIELLESHQVALEEKIKHLHDVKNNIEQLINLEKDASDLTFQIKKYDKRHIYVYDELESDIYTSAKKYYDTYAKIIRSKEYSERTFQMMYPYVELDSGDKINAKQCIELPESDEVMNFTDLINECIILPEGNYLSIYYTFEEGKFEGLPIIKKAIDTYLELNKLTLMNSQIMEIEHPELSLFQNEASTIFELQLFIKKEDTRDEKRSN